MRLVPPAYGLVGVLAFRLPAVFAAGLPAVRPAKDSGRAVIGASISRPPAVRPASSGSGSPVGSTYDFEILLGEHSTSGSVNLYRLDGSTGDDNVKFDGVPESLAPYCCNTNTTPTLNEAFADNGNGTATITITATVPTGKDLFPPGLTGTGGVALTDGGLAIGNFGAGDPLDWTPAHSVVSCTLDVLAGSASIFPGGPSSLDPAAFFGAPGAWNGVFSVAVTNGAGHGSTKAILKIVVTNPAAPACNDATARCVSPVPSARPAPIRVSTPGEAEPPFAGLPAYVPPPLSVSPFSPGGGQSATVTAALPGSTSIQLTFAGPGCGAFTSRTVGGPQAVVTANVGPFGACAISAQFATPGGSKSYAKAFTVEPTEIQLPALEVPDADFRPGDLPAPSGGPGIASASAPGSLINGGTATIRLTLQDPSQASQVTEAFVKVPGASGYDGYWETPVTVDGSTVLVNVSLASDFQPSATSTLSDHSRNRFRDQWELAAAGIPVVIELENGGGKFGNPTTVTFQTQEVGSGSVTVSLSWDTPTDLDLHVVDPNGVEIYYGNPSADGGSLDLDSNAGCSIDGVNNEHITWADSAPAGDYTVRVDFYDSCPPAPDEPGQGADWTVTTTACGDSQTFSGSFSSSNADHGGGGSGFEATTFSADCGCSAATLARAKAGLAAAQCKLYGVTGQARFEKRPFDEHGLADVIWSMPITAARVVVRKVSDDSIVPGADGHLASDGSFALSFTGDNLGQVYAEVRSEFHGPEGRLDQQVVDGGGNVYFARSLPWDPSVDPRNGDVKIVATEDASAPAFNIFRAGVKGAFLSFNRYGNAPPPVTFQWTRGQDAQGECGERAEACFVGGGKIIVGSIVNEAEAYCDTVLLHEYGHLWARTFGLQTEGVGGTHYWNQRSNYVLAFSEGVATFYGQSALGNDVFVFPTVVNGQIQVSATSIEDLAPDIQAVAGTSDNTVTGDINEFYIAAILWDLSDGIGLYEINGFPERISSNNTPFYDTVFQPAFTFHLFKDITNVNRPALTDYLDALCAEVPPDEVQAPFTGVTGIVNGINQYPFNLLGCGSRGP